MTSAGIIVVKHGVIKHLGPWSGHYRSTIEVRLLLPGRSSEQALSELYRGTAERADSAMMPPAA